MTIQKPNSTDFQKPSPSFISLLGLSGLVFFISDVQTGIGPFLSVYLRSNLKWDPGRIGVALAAMSITAALTQIPIGLLIDAARRKRRLIAIAVLLICISCLLILLCPTMPFIMSAQALMGISFTLVGPTITAITLGLVGRKLFPTRIAINQIWNYVGNICTAIASGIAGYFLGHDWILYMLTIFGAVSILFLFLIRPQEINNNIARELSESSPQNTSQANPTPILKLLKSKSFIIFNISVILFHLANAAQLPLAGELLARKNPAADSLFMTSIITITQIVMIGVSFLLKSLVNQIGRKQIFMVGFLVLPIRALLYTLIQNPFLLLAVQTLDGVATGIFGIIAIIIVSDLVQGSGRFNFSQCLMVLCQGIGAALSNVLAGFAVNLYGLNGGFLTLATFAIIGLLFFWLLMPETKNNHDLLVNPS